MRQTTYAVALTEAERARLRTLIGRGEAPARRLTRACILLTANQGAGDPGGSEAVSAGAVAGPPPTAARVRHARAPDALAAARERQHPDRVDARQRAGASAAQLGTVACAAPPAGRARWTPRLLAEERRRLAVVPAGSHEPGRRTVEQPRSKRG